MLFFSSVYLHWLRKTMTQISRKLISSFSHIASIEFQTVIYSEIRKMRLLESVGKKEAKKRESYFHSWERRWNEQQSNAIFCDSLFVFIDLCASIDGVNGQQVKAKYARKEKLTALKDEPITSAFVLRDAFKHMCHTHAHM